MHVHMHVQVLNPSESSATASEAHDEHQLAQFHSLVDDCVDIRQLEMQALTKALMRLTCNDVSSNTRPMHLARLSALC